MTPAILSNGIKFFSRRHVGLTEPRKVRRDDMKSVGKERDQVAEHVARAREAVQQQQHRRISWARLAIENLETIDIGRAVLGGAMQPSLLVTSPLRSKRLSCEVR